MWESRAGGQRPPGSSFVCPPSTPRHTDADSGAEERQGGEAQALQGRGGEARLHVRLNPLGTPAPSPPTAPPCCRPRGLWPWTLLCPVVQVISLEQECPQHSSLWNNLRPSLGCGTGGTPVSALMLVPLPLLTQEEPEATCLSLQPKLKTRKTFLPERHWILPPPLSLLTFSFLQPPCHSAPSHPVFPGKRHSWIPPGQA